MTSKITRRPFMFKKLLFSILFLFKFLSYQTCVWMLTVWRWMTLKVKRDNFYFLYRLNEFLNFISFEYFFIRAQFLKAKRTTYLKSKILRYKYFFLCSFQIAHPFQDKGHSIQKIIGVRNANLFFDSLSFLVFRTELIIFFCFFFINFLIFEFKNF